MYPVSDGLGYGRRVLPVWVDVRVAELVEVVVPHRPADSMTSTGLLPITLHPTVVVVVGIGGGTALQLPDNSAIASLAHGPPAPADHADVRNWVPSFAGDPKIDVDRQVVNPLPSAGVGRAVRLAPLRRTGSWRSLGLASRNAVQQEANREREEPARSPHRDTSWRSRRRSSGGRPTFSAARTVVTQTSFSWPFSEVNSISQERSIPVPSSKTARRLPRLTLSG